MANFRQIHTQIWKDDWFVDLTPEEKILFIYLFSNESSTICGLYKISLRIVSFETGLNMDFIMNALAKFETDKKVVYRDNVVWMVNMRRYHASESVKIKTRIDSDEKFIPDCQLKRAYEYHKDTGKYPMDILSIPYTYPDDKKEKEKEKEEKKEKKKEKEIAPIGAGGSPTIPEIDPIIADIPETFRTDKFIEVWRMWDTFRKELRKPLTKTSKAQQFKMLSDHNVDTAIKIVEQSIRNGWQGLFELKTNGKQAEEIAQDNGDKYIQDFVKRQMERDYGKNYAKNG